MVDLTGRLKANALFKRNDVMIQSNIMLIEEAWGCFLIGQLFCSKAWIHLSFWRVDEDDEGDGEARIFGYLSNLYGAQYYS
jgi:hypothetical protein